MVQDITGMHRDRLARIGFEMFDFIFIFRKTNTKLVVQVRGETAENNKLAVTTPFVASHHGKRATENRKRRRINEKDEEKEEERVLQEQEGQQ